MIKAKRATICPSDPVTYTEQVRYHIKISELPEIFGSEGSTYTELKQPIMVLLEVEAFEGVSRLIE